MMMISDSDRISVTYHSNAREEIEHYSWMLKEDLYQNIVPLIGANLEDVNCSLEPSNKNYHDILIDLLPSRQHSYNADLKDVVLGSIQYIASQLVHNGFIIFEFVTEIDINGKEIYKLENVIGEDVRIKNGNIIQVIPDDVANQLNIPKEILIPNDKCFIINFPDSFGGKAGYQKFIKEFKSLGKQSPMISYFNSSLSGKTGYDLNEHRKVHELELWKKSKIFNWHHRSSFDKSFSGYYTTYRHLNFRRSQILLRDFIIGEIKNIVASLSEKFGARAELKINGLISLNKIEQKIEQWKQGDLKPNSLSEIL